MIALASSCAAAEPDWKLEGWIQGDYTASSASRSNLPLGFNRFADDGHLHQAWLSLDHPRLHADLFVGTDYFFTRARGLFSSQTAELGFDPVQFYVKGHVKVLGRGTDLQLGRFASPIGAEYNAGPANMLPSHSYSFIYDPFTHTGLYASTALDDQWTLLNGIVTGSDVFVDPAMRPTFIDGVRFVDKKDSRKSAQFVTILGPARFDVEHNFNHIDVLDLVVTYPLSRRLLFTGHTVYGWEDGVPGLGDVDWFGVVPYLTWTFSDQLAGTLRLEHFDDDEGNRTGFAGEYRAATFGLTWKAARWLTVRPEVRFDSHDGATPFEGRDHLSTAVLDFFARW